MLKASNGSKKQSKVLSYDQFSGLDLSLPENSQDTGSGQSLRVLNNASIDEFGQIILDSGFQQLTDTIGPVSHIGFLSPSKPYWLENRGDGATLLAEEFEGNQAFQKDSTISSVNFSRAAYIFSYDQPPIYFDGVLQREVESTHLKDIKPAFGTSIARRLTVAGSKSYPTRVYFSHVDNASLFNEDESNNKLTSVLQAAYIDIGNYINSADYITGISSYEQNRLVIFTNDQALIYAVDPDYTKWELDSNANIQVGCVSHNTIVNVGTDLIFCSRTGVHSIKRSQQNGITMESLTFSRKIKDLYLQCINEVTRPDKISAVFDQDRRQYHIFFPTKDGGGKRLTLTLPTATQIPQEVPELWASYTFLEPTCAATLAGQFLIGTKRGIYAENRQKEETGVFGESEITTPILWHKSYSETKRGSAFLLQASGEFKGSIEFLDLYGTCLHSQIIETSGFQDDTFPVIDHKYNYKLPMPICYTALQLRLKLTPKGHASINGLAFEIQNN